MKNPLVACFRFLISCILAGTASAGPPLPLAGDWSFEMDRSDAGEKARWFSRKLADRIILPGVLQAQGFGDEISVDTPWVLGLGGEWWKLQPKEVTDVFSQAGRVEVPFLSQPPRHYLGVAWYQRDVVIPEEAKDLRTELFLERPRWESTVWIDDREIGSARSLVAPHQFELGVLTPGTHRLTIRLDNRMIIRDPKGDNGHMPDAHAVSDALGSTWNGIAGKIELRWTPKIWLSDVQAFPQVADRSVKLKVKLGNLTGNPGRGKLKAGSSETDVTWDGDGGEAELVVPLGANARLWNEFDPYLHQLDVSLESAAGLHSRSISFGLREVTWRGKDLLVNGRVVNIRSTHFGLDFPLTGYPATDVESWQKIIRRCQEFGLNGIRFHSCCPPDAAFTAADELGFYLQAECGLWAPFSKDGVFTRYLEEETPLLLKAYGNHPSFVMFSPANEPAGRYTDVTPQWAKKWHEHDPRRLYSAGTGWNRPEQVTGGAQVAGLVRFGRGELRNVTGWFGNDFRTALEGVEIPVLAHEIGQWCAYPDFKVIGKFTGYLRPSNYHIFRHIAERNGVASINDQLSWASGKFQLACYKEELEANLRTPGLAGHQMLDIRDYLGQGTALIGVLDAFWDPKNYVTGKEFRRFHSSTVPLARLKKRIFTTAETLEADVEIYHFGSKILKDAKPYWKITAADRSVVHRGTWDARDIPTGKNIPLGQISAALAGLPAPAAYQLVVGLDGMEIENDWNFWLYPDKPASPDPQALLVTGDWEAAAKRLEEGGTVVFTPGKKDLDPALSPPMRNVPVFWNIQMTVRPPKNPAPRFDAMLGLLCQAGHPALKSFPTDKFCDWQWTSIIHNVPSVNLTAAPRDLHPIVSAIDDWNRNWRLGVIFECLVGNGRLIVSTIPLNKSDPVTKQLRRSLMDYAVEKPSLPIANLTTTQADALWRKTEGNPKPPANRQFDPDQDDGTIPRAAESIKHEEVSVKAPFPMPAIKVPVFPKNDFIVTKFGATGADISEAIRKAISACHDAGGGRVVIPKGKWRTGKIHFQSNVNLHLEKDARLTFSGDPKDYLPAVQSSWEGFEGFNYSPLVYAFNCENVAITGEGTLEADMTVWNTWMKRPPAHMEALKKLYTMASTHVPVEQRQMAEGENNLRPQFIQFNRCKNVLIENIRIRNSPFWTIHLFLSESVVVRGIDIYAHGHNNDGIDPEMTRNLLVENCRFDQGDDAIAIKSGSNHDGWRLNRPTENVVIRNCTVVEGHQLVAIGSELSGGIRNVYVHDCKFVPGYTPQNLLFIKTNHRRGGFVENIHMENIEAAATRHSVLGIETDVLYQWKTLVPTYEERITKIRGIHLRNIKVGETGRSPFRILGDKREPVTDVSIDDITIGKVWGKRNEYKNTGDVHETNIRIGELLTPQKPKS